MQTAIGIIVAVLGGALWIIAAQMDRVFNGADAGGIAVLAVGAVVACSRSDRDEA